MKKNIVENKENMIKYEKIIYLLQLYFDKRQLHFDNIFKSLENIMVVIEDQNDNLNIICNMKKFIKENYV